MCTWAPSANGELTPYAGPTRFAVIEAANNTLNEEQGITRVRQLTNKPIQYILNTGFQAEHTGGNVALRASGGDPSVRGSFFALQFADAGVGATIVAHQNVQNRMVAAKTRRGRPASYR